MHVSLCWTRRPAGIAGAVVLPVAGVVGGAVQVGRGIANQSEAIREKKAGRIWNKVGRASTTGQHPAATMGWLGAGPLPFWVLFCTWWRAT